MKKIFNFIARWSDILVLIPFALVSFICNGFLIRSLDATASIVNVEFLSILNFNILVFSVVSFLAWFMYNKLFHDFFVKGWETRVGNIRAATIHLILWLSTLISAYFIITHNL